MELVKCSDYVVSMGKTSKDELSDDDCFKMMFGYANFLKRPLELGMFIPCDLEGNVLEIPDNWESFVEFSGVEVEGLKPELYQYQQAKERVLFGGVEVKEYNLSYQFWVGNKYISYDKPNGYFSDYDFIEQLTSLGLTLTQTAIKIINK